MKQLLFFLLLLGMISCDSSTKLKLNTGEILITWHDSIAGDFSFKDSWSYSEIDTTHEYHTIKSDAWTYEWAGTDFITVKRVSKDTVICYTLNNAATHSSLDLIIIKDIVKPSISVTSVTPTGTRTYPCNGGQIAIDRILWNKGIMKAEFDFTFEHKQNPDQPMYWKGKIFAKIESKQ